MKRLALVLLAACSAGGGATTSSHHETAEAVHTVEVTRGQVIDRVLLTGGVAATSAAELRTPRTDTWELPIRWLAEDGAIVKQGDKVLEFDNSSFTSNLAQQKLAYLDSQISFRTAETVAARDLDDKAFALQTAQIALAKAKLLASVPEDLLPARTFQERQLDAKRSERAVERAQTELASAKATAALDRQVKQIELDKTKAVIDNAEKSIGELLIRAPRDGVVVIGEHPWEERKFQNGDNTQPGWTIVTLPDFGAGMEVHAELSDVDDGRISIGMTGTCTLDAYPADPLVCTVKDLLPVATSGDRQSLRRGFAATLVIEKFDRDHMRPGMAVKVELHRQPLEGPVVPRAAIRFDEDGKKARVKLASGQMRDVELDACDAQSCAVKSGVALHDKVQIGGGS